MTKGKRGGGSKHQLLWEEVPFLKVEKTGKPVAIYKREDVQKVLPLEQRNYYAHFPIRGTRGKRMSLLVSEREDALMRVQEEAVNLRVQLAQGVIVVIKTTVEDLVAKFLAYKRSRIRGEWEGKGEAGRKSITKERYALIEGKLRNYLVPFPHSGMSFPCRAHAIELGGCGCFARCSCPSREEGACSAPRPWASQG